MPIQVTYRYYTNLIGAKEIEMPRELCRERTEIIRLNGHAYHAMFSGVHKGVPCLSLVNVNDYATEGVVISKF